MPNERKRLSRILNSLKDKSMKTRCLILDDDPLARNITYRHTQKFETLNVVAQCMDTEHAAQVLAEGPVDLIFLDVHLPLTSGIDFLKSLASPPHVIVTSAHREYAWECFEMDVVDFLLKPITFERFMRAVHKFQHLTSSFQLDFNAGVPCLFVRENKKVVKIPLCEIQYVEGLGEYIQIHTQNRKIVTKMGMSQIEEKLPSRFFLRIHKSYLISLTKVQAYTSSSIEINGADLPIGRSYKNTVMNVLNFEGIISGGQF